MITKTALAIDKVLEYSIPGAFSGAFRASTLSKEEKEALTREYGLDSEADLIGRNAARGYAGSLAGLLAGGAVFHPIGEAVFGRNMKARVAGSVGAGIGGGIGLLLSTRKYSKDRAEELLKERKK